MAKKFLTDIDIAGGIYDSSGDIGNSGQILSSTGSGLNWIDSTASSSVIYQDAFSGNGSATAFTLANSVDNENKTQVYIDGVYQFKNTYSISGTTLTFSTAPPNNTDIEVISFNSITADGDILTDSEFGSAGLMTTNGSGVYSITTNNSSNWNTAYTYSQVGHLPLAGGAITGAITTNSTFDGRDVATDGTKLDGIETGADVTDVTNVTAAGALMDSELTDLAGVKAVTISDLATVTYVDSEVAGLVDSSPATLNTLNELAAALGDDANFSTTVTNSIALKAPLASPTFTGNITLSGGHISLNANDDSRISGDSDSIDFNLWDNSSAHQTRMTILDTGNVGIGTTSPSQKLHVLGSQLIFGNLFLEGSANSFRAISMNTSDGSDNQTLSLCGGATSSSARGGRVDIKGNEVSGGGGIVKIVAGNVSTGDIELYTANTSRMIINNAGNVGIGTTSPSSNLTVEGAPANGVYLSYLYNSATHNSAHGLNVQTSSNNILTYGLRVNTAGDSNALAVMGNGSVGIGTASPASKFEVYGGNSGVNDVDRYIRFKASNGEKRFDFYVGGTGNASSLGMYTSDGTTKNVQIASGGTSYFNGGDVGIGTTSPQAQLHINEDTSNSYATLRLEGANRGGIIDMYNQTSYPVSRILTDQSGNIFISTSGAFASTSLSEKFTILTGGNVGIGTTSPATKLDVTGTDNGDTVRVANTGTYGGTISFNQGAGHTNIGYVGSLRALEGNASGDNGIGLYSRDRISFYTSSTTPDLTIADNGNVGIGATSPGAKLQVNDAVYSQIRMHSDHTYSVNRNWRFITNNFGNGNWGGFSIESSSTQGGTSYTPKFGIDVNGNVGIGINASNTTISDKLVVSSGNIRIVNNSPMLRFRDTDITNLEHRVLGGGNQGLEYSADVNNVTAGYHRWDIANSEKMRLIENGNLGIGTTTPNGRLDVRGAISSGMALEDENVSLTSNGGTPQASGILEISQGWSCSSSSGDTIVFRHNSTSWKAWVLHYNFASTNGITVGVIGGYWNNSGSQSNNFIENNLQASVAVTHGGTGNQNIIVTFTFTALGVHPLSSFKYIQHGGDGKPLASKTSITLNS